VGNNSSPAEHPSRPPTRVLLVDDHTLVRAGFRALLGELGIQVVGEAGDGAEALRLIARQVPDVVLIDIAMPGLNGLEATARMVQEFPGVRVIILSMHATAEYARRALRAGAAGYLVKNAGAAELDLAITAAVRGDLYLSPEVAKVMATDYTPGRPGAPGSGVRLTPRQREILQLIAQGYTRKQIAAQLVISVKTFDTYRAQLMKQVAVHDAAGLMRYAMQIGLGPRDE